jgi:hypothetical protein
MLRQTISLAAAFALCGGVGCGGKSEVSPKDTPESSHKASTTDMPDGLMVRFLSEVNEVSDAMERKEPKETIDKLFQKAEATNKKLREWPLPTEDKKKLEDKYRPEIEKAMARYFQAGDLYAATGNQVPRFTGMGTAPAK